MQQKTSAIFMIGEVKVLNDCATTNKDFNMVCEDVPVVNIPFKGLDFLIGLFIFGVILINAVLDYEELSVDIIIITTFIYITVISFLLLVTYISWRMSRKRIISLCLVGEVLTIDYGNAKQSYSLIDCQWKVGAYWAGFMSFRRRNCIILYLPKLGNRIIRIKPTVKCGLSKTKFEEWHAVLR
ncbi:MAG: hypothetical protein HQL32_07265 [Planctomycetes bacterium]|nr:hypothetical protein [Planctomycetota bacterium]